MPAENRPTRKSNRGVDAARVVPNARIRRFGHSRARARTADLRDLRAGCANPSVPSKTRSSPARGRIVKLHRPLHRAGYPPLKISGPALRREVTQTQGVGQYDGLESISSLWICRGSVLLQRFPVPAPQPEDLFIGDVGQDSFEEVDFQPAASTGGENYGWRLMEATHCFNPASNCNDGSLTLPVIEYSHATGDCSISGGYRYRGASSPDLSGIYFYADFCTGKIWGATETSPGEFSSELISDTGFSITAFGED